MKPRIHIFKGRYYCVGNGVGHGLTPELAYYSWRDACARQLFDWLPNDTPYNLRRTTGVTHTPVIS